MDELKSLSKFYKLSLNIVCISLSLQTHEVMKFGATVKRQLKTFI